MELGGLIKYSAYDPNVNLTVSLLDKGYNENDVKGIQFDIIYDSTSVILNELTSTPNEKF